MIEKELVTRTGKMRDRQNRTKESLTGLEMRQMRTTIM